VDDAGAGAGAGALVPLPAAAVLDELAGLDGAACEPGELADEPQPAASAAQISAAAIRPARGFRLPERSRIGNTPVPPILLDGAVRAVQQSMTVGTARRLVPRPDGGSPSG
jgi:hypothetical protein